MTTTGAEVLYVGKNNEIQRTFLENGVAKNVSLATKIALFLQKTAGTALADWDTVDEADLFDTTNLATGIIIFQPAADTITASEPDMTGSQQARYIVYTADEPQGVVFPWFDVAVKE